jgi:hypothetical protein
MKRYKPILRENISKPELLKKMPVWFRKYNKQLWNDELSTPIFQVKPRKNMVGLYSPQDKTILLSNFYDLTEEQYESVFVHEMVHLYQHEFFNIVDHGRTFNKELNRINRILPFEVKPKESAYEIEYGQDTSKKVGVVLGKDRHGSFVVTFKLDFFLDQSNQAEIEKIIKQNFKTADILVMGVSDHQKLQTFKIKRSLRSLDIYNLADKYFDDIYKSIEDKKEII